MLLFGVGYGAASLGCTLPLFLTLVGASLSGGGKITTFRLRSRHGRRADGALRAGCSGGKSAAPPQPRSTAATGSTKSGMPGPRQLTDVRDVGQLRSLFNTRSGEPRLILLASPT